MTRLRFLITAGLAALGALSPWRKKAIDLNYTQVTYALMRRRKDGQDQWQWRTAKGQEMSPVFHCAKAATDFKKQNGTFIKISETIRHG